MGGMDQYFRDDLLVLSNKRVAILVGPEFGCVHFSPALKSSKAGRVGALSSKDTRASLPILTAEDLKSILRVQGWKQKDLAARLGVSKQAVSDWVNRERGIRKSVTAALIAQNLYSPPSHF